MTTITLPSSDHAMPLAIREYRHGMVRGMLRGLCVAAMAGCLTCVAYLCKCKMGIDLFEGPSCLHNALYWIVR